MSFQLCRSNGVWSCIQTISLFSENKGIEWKASCKSGMPFYIFSLSLKELATDFSRESGLHKKYLLRFMPFFSYFLSIISRFFCHFFSISSFALPVPPKCHQREEAASPWDFRFLAPAEKAKAKFLLPNIRLFATSVFPYTAKMQYFQCFLPVYFLSKGLGVVL